MLGADVSRSLPGRFGRGQFHDLLGVGGHAHGLDAGCPLADGLDDGSGEGIPCHTIGKEYFGSHAPFFSQKAQENVLRAHIVVAQSAGRLIGKTQGVLGFFRPSVVCHVKW